MADDPPSVGDLAWVKRDHCGRSGTEGHVHRVLEIDVHPEYWLKCSYCRGVFCEGRPHARLDCGDGSCVWHPLEWLRRLKPLADLESIDIADELDAERPREQVAA